MIVKTVKTEKFLQLDNNTVRDANLSLDTRGFQHHILSYSQDFEISAEGLMKMFGIGREKLLRMTNELKQFGYLEIRGARNEKGAFVGKEWIFYDVSQNADFRVSQDTGNPHVGVSRTSGEPYDNIRKDEDSLKNDLKGKENTGWQAGSHVDQAPVNGHQIHRKVKYANRNPPAGPPARVPQKETEAEYLERKQREYPNLDVQAVYKKYLAFCKAKGLFAKRRFFDDWLAEEDEPLTGAAVQTDVPDWKKAIDACGLCDERGLHLETLLPCGHKEDRV